MQPAWPVLFALVHPIHGGNLVPPVQDEQKQPKEGGCQVAQKTPFKEEKRHVHLLVDPAAYRLAKIECAKIDLDLSHATELIWKLWSQGKIQVKKEQS